MTNQERNAMTSFAAAKIGYGYIYGATGWVCTPARLEQQATQYPEYAAAIRQHGSKWIGRECYDCAQLTRQAAKAAGIALPSGATSQWKADVWADKGTINTLPKDEPGILLYRESGGKMQHTGVYMGDGTFVDARGHAYGVVRGALGTYAWTHWGRLRGVGSGSDGNGAVGGTASAIAGVSGGKTAPSVENVASFDGDQLAYVTSDDGNPVKLRGDPSARNPYVGKIAVGTLVTVHETGEASDGVRWATVTVQWSGQRGYIMDKFLLYRE